MKLRGGEKFNEAIRDIVGKLSTKGTMRVGFLSGATYPDAPPRQIAKTYGKMQAKGYTGAIAGAKKGTLSVATVAFWNEFGTSRSPARPFFRNMIAAKSNEWGPALALALRRNNYDTRLSLNQIGSGIAGQLRESIIETNEPPNAESTIRKKGFSKTLVDSGHMLQSVDFEIEG